MVNGRSLTTVPKTNKIRTGTITALDVGTGKVCCLIGRVLDDGAIRVVGFGHHLSAGLRNGAVIDMDAAEASIRAAVDDAEQMAGERVQRVVVNISGGQRGAPNSSCGASKKRFIARSKSFKKARSLAVC